MRLPTIGKGTIQSLGRQTVPDDSGGSGEGLGKIVSTLAGVYQEYAKNKDITNTKNLGIELSRRLSSAKLKMLETDSVTKEMLSSVGVHDFDSDSRGEIPTFEVEPFVNKSIVENFVRENSGSFNNEKLGSLWAKEYTNKALEKFGDELYKVNKIIKKNQIASLESDIGIAQDQGDFVLSASIIKLLPEALRKDYNHENNIKQETSALNSQMASGTDEQLKVSLDYLQSKEYEGLPANESMSFVRKIRAELSKRVSIAKVKTKSENIIISRAIRELSTSIKKGDQNSFEALDKFSIETDFDSLSKKQQLDLRKVQSLRHNIKDLRSLSSSTDRDDYVSGMCKSGDENCNDIKVIQNKDIAMMAKDPMQYAMNIDIAGVDTIDFENDSDVDIADGILERIKSKEFITQYIGHKSLLLTNNEASQFNNKLQGMEPEERVSSIVSMLKLVGDESFLILSSQVSGKINSNYYIAKSMMMKEGANAVAIAKGSKMHNYVSQEDKNLIKSNITERLWGKYELIDGAVDAVTSLIAYQIHVDGDYTDSTLERKDDFFADDIDTIQEYITQVIGRTEDISGSDITLPNLSITNREFQTTLNRINPDSIPEPFNKDISRDDIAEGLKSHTLVPDMLADSKYILKDSSIPSVYFVVERISGVPVMGNNNKAYKINFNNITEIIDSGAGFKDKKDRDTLDKLKGQL